jgi:hypothetical protein
LHAQQDSSDVKTVSNIERITQTGEINKPFNQSSNTLPNQTAPLLGREPTAAAGSERVVLSVA